MVTSMGMPGLAGMFGMGGAGGQGQVPPPFASQPAGLPYQAAPSWAQRIAGQPAAGQMPQNTPQNIPPHIAAMLAQMRAYNADPAAGQYPGAVPPQPGQTPWGQGGQAPHGQMPFGNWAGILSGMGGQMPWNPQQPPRGMPPQPMPQYRQPVRPPAQQARPRRAVYGGGAAGNISLSGY